MRSAAGCGRPASSVPGVAAAPSAGLSVAPSRPVALAAAMHGTRGWIGGVVTISRKKSALPWRCTSVWRISLTHAP